MQRKTGNPNEERRRHGIRREEAALAWLESIGWSVVSGVEIAPGEPDAEREDYRQVILERRCATRWRG
jgi:hypothetical protein